MKQGAGENPFADDDAEGDGDRDDAEGPDGSSGTREGQATEPEPATTADKSTESGRSGRQLQIPYKFRRDGVQDGRSRVPLFLHEETKRGERDAQRELEARFDDDVSLTDLREALMLAGLQHLDEVEGQLEEWGYGMTFDE
jgi:hypothetical protein